MRILYLDIDALRPDHLGCYGYPRATSPHIDALAAEGLRFENIYASDTPCAPSRTALFSGRFGVHTGVVCHAGSAAAPRGDGVRRGFTDTFSRTSWPAALRRAGYHTAAISSFGQRHSAWWWHAGFHEVIDNGGGGNEIAERVADDALAWLDRRGPDDRWFCHVNFWDVHTPYRTPETFGNPFEPDPPPAWLTDEIRQRHFTEGAGAQGARERGDMMGIDEHRGRFPRQPFVMDSMAQVKRMFDGYDTAIRYVDEQIGRLVAKLASLGVLDQTAIVISADHGENLGESNIYGCHQTADEATAHVPLILRWPGVTDAQAGRTDAALRYHVDFAATVLELAGAATPENWDGRGFADELAAPTPRGRDHLVLSQMQGTCQRAARFVHAGHDYLFIRTWHDGFRNTPDRRLYDVGSDPHQLHDLIAERPEPAALGERLIDNWMREQIDERGVDDPMGRVLAEGGPPHCRSMLPKYLDRLRETGRGRLADAIEARHPIRS